MIKQEELNIIFNRNIEIINTFMGFLVPEGICYSSKGMTMLKIVKKKNPATKEIEDIAKNVLISDKWIFVTANVYSEAQYIYQMEVKTIDPISKKELTKVCNREVLSRSQMCLTFLSNEHIPELRYV